MIPTLETERLVLRAMKAEDFEPFAAFYATEAARFVGGPEDRIATWRRMAAYAGSWTLRGYGKFVVEEKQTGRPVGMAGPWFPEDWPEPELSWTFLPEFQGRGYATEAAACSLVFAYDELGWATAISAIAPGNHRSIRLAERLGAHREGSTEVDSVGALDIYRHLPPSDFRAHLARMQ